MAKQYLQIMDTFGKMQKMPNLMNKEGTNSHVIALGVQGITSGVSLRVQVSCTGSDSEDDSKWTPVLDEAGSALVITSNGCWIFESMPLWIRIISSNDATPIPAAVKAYLR